MFKDIVDKAVEDGHLEILIMGWTADTMGFEARLLALRVVCEALGVEAGTSNELQSFAGRLDLYAGC